MASEYGATPGGYHHPNIDMAAFFAGARHLQETRRKPENSPEENPRNFTRALKRLYSILKPIGTYFRFNRNKAHS